TRTFDWTPTFSQSGTFHVDFIATDNALIPASDTEHVAITVIARSPGSNTAPVLAPITDQSTHVGDPLAFSVSATDYEGGPLTFSATGLPAGAAFDGATRTLSWTPAPGSEGAYSVTIHVADSDAAADSQAVPITVVPKE